MNKKQTKEYWQLKNRIGYTVLTGDAGKRVDLEAEMEAFLKGCKTWQE